MLSFPLNGLNLRRMSSLTGTAEKSSGGSAVSFMKRVLRSRRMPFALGVVAVIWGIITY